MTTNPDYAAFPDQRLVELHLDGDPAAFHAIVLRYQSMVCALGLCWCGNAARSEDLAQEVFLAAWKQLPSLREPQKLRAWLAAIARNLFRNSYRQDRRAPTAQAESLSPETAAAGEDPREQATLGDEAALMWRTLESLPVNFREPMVLFYRENRSIAAVGEALELSEDAVRQRLSRGRALLTERMASLVEETLTKGAPSAHFAANVMLAIPGPLAALAAGEAAAAGAAKGSAAKTAATVGGAVAAAAKGGVVVKALAMFALLPTLAGGAMGFLKFRTQYEGARSRHEKRRIMATYLAPNFIAVGLGAAFFVLRFVTPYFHDWYSPWLWLVAGLGIVGIPVVTLILVSKWLHRSVWLDRQTGTEFFPASEAKPFEYRSRRAWLGLPLVDVQISGPGSGRRRTARGWIAVSDGIALGGLAACGGRFGLAPISFGLGAVGVLSVGAVAIGVGAFGGAAGGYFAFGILAFAWKAAMAMTYAVAGDFAQAHQAWAIHANDAAATFYLHHQSFFQAALAMVDLAMVVVWFLWAIPLALTAWYFLSGTAENASRRT